MGDIPLLNGSLGVAMLFIKEIIEKKSARLYTFNAIEINESPSAILRACQFFVRDNGRNFCRVTRRNESSRR